MIIVQPCERIGLLPGERFGRAQRADRGARRAGGGVKLLAGDGAGGEAGEQAAFRVGQVVRGGAAGGRADEVAGQAVVVGLAGKSSVAGFIFCVYLKLWIAYTLPFPEPKYTTSLAIAGVEVIWSAAWYNHVTWPEAALMAYSLPSSEPV